MTASIEHCNKCILPGSYPGIVFNDEGICNYCLAYRPQQILGKGKLLEILTSKPKKGRYDCVVPISGGKDSTYILYYVVRELKLNPIAVIYNSVFANDIAIDNAKNACSLLGITLIEVKSPKSIRTNLLKESLLVSEKFGYFWHSCGNCEAILRTVSINTAREYGAPFVIWGSSAIESADSSNYKMYRDDGGPQDRVLNKIAYGLNYIMKHPKKLYKLPKVASQYWGYHQIKYYYYSILERLALKFPYRIAFRPFTVPPFSDKHCEFVHFYDYVDWDSITNIAILENELNWKHPVGQLSRWDCMLHCFTNYSYLKANDISWAGKNSCNLVRENKLDREEAMKKEDELRKSVRRECEELIHGIGLKKYEVPWPVK
jgi:hypothetical protein